MKNRFNLLLYFLFGILLFWNCSSDDDSSYSNETSDKNYFPLVINNEWQYENKQTSEGETEEASETLNVEDEQQDANGARFNLNSTADNGGLSFTSILANGEVFKNEQQLLLTGNFDIGLDQAEIPDFDIDFEGLVVFDADAINGSVLFAEDRNFDLPEFNNIALSVSLSIESVSLGSLDEIEVNNQVYEDVIASQFVISLGVEATVTVPPLPFPLTVDVIEFQEILIATNYFANEVGLVQSETDLSIEFSDALNQIPDFNLDDIEVLIEQDLIDYQVSLEN